MVAIAGIAMALALGRWAGPLGRVGGGLLILGARIYVGLLSATWSRRAPHPGVIRPRRLLTVALFLWVVADAGDLIGATATGSLIGPQSLPNLTRAAGYLAVVAAFASLRTVTAGRFGRYRNAIDIAILATGVLALASLVVVLPVIAVGLTDPIGAGWYAFPLAIDGLVLVLVLRLILLQLCSRWFGSLMALAFLLHGFSDAVAAYRILGDQAGANSTVWTGWLLASLLMAAAISKDLSSPRGFVLPGAQAMPAWTDRLESLLPITLTYAVVGYTMAVWWLTRDLEWIGVGAGAAMMILLVARQGVIAGQMELQQYVALVNASADLAFIAEPDGRILLANPAVYSAAGRAPEDGVAMDLVSLLGEEARGTPILESAADGSWSGEVTLLRRDGSRLPVALSLRRICDEGKARVLLAGTAHDLTTIRQRESELRQALDEIRQARSQLQELNRELEGKVEARTKDLAAMVENLARLNDDLKALDRLKSEFVALVSHELRAPLTNIRSGIELALSSEEGLQGTISHSLKLVGEETERLSRFVEAILDLSSLEAGKYPIQLMPISLEDLATSVMVRIRAADARGRIRVRIPAGLPHVMADERALGSVIFHLIENALKYAPHGDVELGAQETDGRIVVQVSDHGPGIPEEERESVFEMFRRLDTRDAREIYGHGLGLFTARKMVEAMGGSIWAEAAPGGGACFSVSLAARQAGNGP
jgi:PAS domain S-box-containing protein